MTIQYRKYVSAVVEFGGTTPDYSCQVTTLGVVNATPDGTKVYTFCASGAGEFRETPDSAWQCTIKWISDWTSTGLNRYLATNDGATVAVSIHYDNGDSNYGRTWSGNVVLKQPSDGGDVRATETSEMTLNFIGVPTLAYGA